MVKKTPERVLRFNPSGETTHYIVPFCSKKMFAERSTSIAGPQIWNHLLEYLGNIQDYDHVNVDVSFCLVIIVWLNQVQNLKNRIKFLF